MQHLLGCASCAHDGTSSFQGYLAVLLTAVSQLFVHLAMPRSRPLRLLDPIYRPLPLVSEAQMMARPVLVARLLTPRWR